MYLEKNMLNMKKDSAQKKKIEEIILAQQQTEQILSAQKSQSIIYDLKADEMILEESES